MKFITPYKNYFLQYLNKLNPRERYFVLVGGGLALILILYWLVWAPFFSERDNLRQRVQDKSALAQWMNAAVENLLQLQGQGTRPTMPMLDALPVTVNNSLKQYGINTYVNQIEIPTANRVSIKFNPVPFDKVLQWTMVLWQRYQIKVVELNATAQSMPGMVQMNMILEKS